MRALREFVQVIGVKNVMRRELSVEVYGVDELRQLEGAALIVANHASHLDTAVLLSTLPTKRRRRTAVGVASGYFFDSSLRAGASAIAFNTFPIEQDGAVTTPAKLLAKGWSVVLFPEGSRSRDGFVGPFQIYAAEIAVNARVAVIPVGILGTYAAMPRGSNRPVPGRPRVSVRYGPSIISGSDETAGEFAPKIFDAVKKLLAEDAATWWKAQQGVADVPEPPASSWRRIWQQSDPPVKGGKPPAEKIWRR
ncbi:MAG TPA: lysophospholipid acyltransferase family protein [Propionibacteriaceae bacterium]|nr:lysophospholipid acyltransferase family protein [Propionibacteriaceae bacterium]